MSGRRHSAEGRRHRKFCTALRIVLPEPDWEFVVFTRFNQIDNFFNVWDFQWKLFTHPKKRNRQCFKKNGLVSVWIQERFINEYPANKN